ncbi:sensor histidine kinase [Aquirufa ecclesiirivi]|uniref:histidine kinase n=1 Tax=Aquirufa ecclesiirivi TaxID=2715124 RepID=A0ABT4JGR0_9BACT|nr:HAMP domain-containing sensor histidine kinase [Aquirufa ecclesiirivi]MCZ2472616.1 HAMP domain-containing histidine kinase [Aquirufa ecclesiirivi]MCZ2475475.1 HAMP domain-containing histidine kinase [Aquirufa ecclesiirivi]NHC48785.1 HAMP domain-containing histidine kinase [Aquirufa ecclesiirivi]
MFKEVSLPLAFYNRDTWLKVAFFAVCVFMAGFSLYFTDGLVTKLEEREKQQIELYAETIRYVMTSDENADINFFFERIKKINENNTIPVIWKDGSGHLNSINIPMPNQLSTEAKQDILKQKLNEIILENNKPIEMDMGFQKEYIYYGNSKLLKLLRYYPLSQLLVVLIIGFLGYIFFSYSRRAEQNRVWVGLAKETAHQLGTPLSSLTAWVEILRNEPSIDPNIVIELSKDIQRLETITTRFSNIGSAPILKEENLEELISTFLLYLKNRISSKVHIEIISMLAPDQVAKVNRYLFEWVIENICKNAVDAMSGSGDIQIILTEGKNNLIYIDISDTGKGISNKNMSKIFSPGFSTKKRGWGLGLTLAKRIVENYHEGKLILKSTEINKGSTFRISLPKPPLHP